MQCLSIHSLRGASSHKYEWLNLYATLMLQTALHFTSTLHVLILAVMFLTYDGGHNAMDAITCSSRDIIISWC